MNITYLKSSDLNLFNKYGVKLPKDSNYNVLHVKRTVEMYLYCTDFGLTNVQQFHVSVQSGTIFF